MDKQSPEVLLEQARQLVTSQLSPSQLKTTADLPAYQQGHFEFDDGMSNGEVLVDQARYERLRTAALPVLYHSTAHEVGRFIAYDPVSKSGVAVLEAWL